MPQPKKKKGLIDMIKEMRTIEPQTFPMTIAARATLKGQGQPYQIRETQYKQIDTQKTIENNKKIGAAPKIAARATLKGQGQGQPKNTKIKEIKLATKQRELYFWFLKNGASGSFNRMQIEAETSLKYNGIRKALKKFESLELIKFDDFNFSLNAQNYQLVKYVKIIETSKKGQGQGQGQPYQTITSNKSVSKFFNKLLTYLESEQYLCYWKKFDLSPKKIILWMQEFDLSEEQMLNQLRYAAFEWHDKTETEVKKPVGKFYVALKSGGFSKPSGYKTPEEKRLEIVAKDIEEKKAILKSIHEKNEQAKELAFQIWAAQLSNPEKIKIIESSNLTPKQKAKASGPAVEAILKRHFWDHDYQE